MTSIPVYAFSAFRLLPSQRLLLSGERPLKLGSRAFDLLLALVERHERVVDKQELLDLVWPGEDVGEANLAVHVMALRKLLGRSAIATVPGRGYRFTLPLQPVPGVDAPSTANETRDDELFGRETEVPMLIDLIERHALVSVIGPGGVGKTRLAQQAMALLQPRAAAGIPLVELASIADPLLVSASVARALRISTAPRDALAAVANVLHAAPTLIVLDNAEHVLDGVIALATALHERAPRARLLVTSQEPLRLAFERVMRLEPLPLPQEPGYDSSRNSGAVRLFEARVQRLAPGFRLDPRNCATMADICSRLDGLPLAIELAAARVPLLGLDGLRALLGERLRVLASPARSPLPRHQTLRATLDWSHSLLDPAEQRLLRRLSVFAGGFTLPAAQAACRDEALDEWGVLDKLGALVDRSIVVSDGQAVPRFRLLETTRLYALERLRAAGEEAAMHERHARAMERLLRVEHDDGRLWRTPPPAVPALAAEVDNARAALAWASGSDDDALAIGLAAGASHVFFAASLNAEYLQRVMPLRDRARAPLPPHTIGLFWARIAWACARNAHPAGLDAALRAAQVYRSLNEPGRLYDALTWTLAIGSRHDPMPEMEQAMHEAEALEQPGWPPALRSSYQWAKHRWLQSQGRAEEALRCAQAQADLLAQAGHWATHVALGANVADCELSLGHLERAETLARGSLDALDALGVDDNLVGHVMDMLVVALTLQGRAADAVRVGRRALRLLQREGDDLRLLDTLALNATTAGRWADAARIAAHAEAAIAATGERRWPAAAARRRQLEQRLEGALAGEVLRRLGDEGAAMTRDQAFDLALRD